MQKTCANPWCRAPFEILDADREMAKKFDVEWDPQICSDCRHQHRGMFSAQLILHRRKSSLTGKPVISIYSEKKPFPVYAIDEWWSDRWDGIAFGKSFDFGQAFFSQFRELFFRVPKMANTNENCENCEYTYSAGNAKNAYYSRSIHRSEDVYYSESITGYARDCIDCLRCQKSSQLWECAQCRDCHLSTFLFRCFLTRDSHFCFDCRGCSDCIFCWNLRSKSYHIWNKPVSKEEFLKIKASIIDGKWSTLQQNLKKWEGIGRNAIWPNLSMVNCEECRGDQLFNSSQCFECYNCFNSVGNRYCWELTPSEKCISSMELTRGGIGELLFHCTSLGGGNYFMRMCAQCRLCSDLTYCIDCYSCRDCFGCTGLRRKRYCVLNEQYSKEEYEALVRQITDHMKKSGEWGEFFPLSITPLSYSESVAMNYFPLTKEEVLARGWVWTDPPDIDQEGLEHRQELPDGIDQVAEDITQKILFCQKTGRKYKIIPQELQYYRQLHVPLPRHHPDVRMQRRRELLNLYKLWKRPCMKCGQEMETSFSPERPEIVYCETCYLKAVY